MAEHKFRMLSILTVCAAALVGPAYAAEAPGADTLCNPVQDSRSAPVRSTNGLPVRHAGSYNCPPVAAEPAPIPVPATSYMVFFDFDRSDITPASRDVLQSVAASAMQGQAQRVNVTGHTDTSGPAAHNDALSVRRAEAVRRELVRLGIPNQYITAIGVGERQLLVQTPDGVREPSNRRAEIVFP